MLHKIRRLLAVELAVSLGCDKSGHSHNLRADTSECEDRGRRYLFVKSSALSLVPQTERNDHGIGIRITVYPRAFLHTFTFQTPVVI